MGFELLKNLPVNARQVMLRLLILSPCPQAELPTGKVIGG